ncbi:cation/H(+) antiporter 19 isoform X2 [Cryptomeria japonica]|nr:cation/H(+) antiporter 19 isoform X2 [Cryptomeria japonica]
MEGAFALAAAMNATAKATANATCFKLMKTTSNGGWQGDNPINFALPLLILQICLVLTVTRTLAFLFRPLRQPRVVAEIIGGIILGPSVIGRSESYMKTVFPKNSTPVLETVANIGLLFFLFLVGLELDFNAIKRTGRKSLAIAAAGITLPFVAGIGVAFLLRSTISKGVDYGAFLVFMGVALSITAFPVLARILAELKLLTRDVGQLAMSAAAVNDVVAWILLAIAVALSGSGKSPVISVYVLLCGVVFVAFMMLAVRPMMALMGRRSPDNEPVSELFICITLAGVLASGFVTDAIGIHSIFGAFVFGLTIPKEGPFAGMLIEKIEDFVGVLLLPLYFASSGLKTNISTVSSAQSWGLLVLVILTACAGKILGTLFVSLAHKVSFRESLTLGFLMNTKGLVELIVLNIGKDRKVLNDEVFALMVLMALFTTFITTPIVMAIYKPARKQVPYKHRKLQRDKQKDELRILACVHGTKNIPAIINLMEASRGTRKSALRLYIMHLVELSERSSSIMLVHKARKNGQPFWNRNRSHEDQIVIAFDAFEQLSKVAVRPMTEISAFQDMHVDICNVAEEKRAAMIILPFHKYQRVDGVLESVNAGIRTVNQKVLKHAPCSVGILVNRGLGGQSQLAPSSVSHNIAVLFFGGPDDREALVYGRRMAEHPGIKLSVIRFLPNSEINQVALNLTPLPVHDHDKHRETYTFSTAEMNREQESVLDEEALADIISDVNGSVPSTPKKSPGRNVSSEDVKGSIVYTEQQISNTVESVLSIGKSNEYNLILVGRGRFPSPLVADLADRTAECAELGPIGDLLASSSVQISASVLVIQQHDHIHTDEVPFSKSTNSATPLTIATE